VMADMAGGLTGGETGLAGLWRFEDGSGLRATDETANGNHGTLKGSDAEDTPAWYTAVSGTEYTVTRQVYLPTRNAGTYYLVMKTDEDLDQGESDENDNDDEYAAITIESADLEFAGTPTVPTAAAGGTYILVSWTVKNNGPGSANANWYDNIYLSDDDTLDVGVDTRILHLWQSDESPLAALAQYTPSRIAPCGSRMGHSGKNGSFSTPMPMGTKAKPTTATTSSPCRSHSTPPT